MANCDICGAEYIIQGPLDEIDFMFESIKKWTEVDGKEYMYGETWLGRIIQGAGFSVSDYPNSGLMTRSEVILRDENVSLLRIGTVSIGAPCVEMWKPIVHKWAPHCEIFYFTQQPAIHEFVTNDVNGVFFRDSYVLECHLNKHKGNAGPYSNIRDLLTIVSEYQMRSTVSKLLEMKNDDTISNNELLNRLNIYTIGWTGEKIKYYKIQVKEEL